MQFLEERTPTLLHNSRWTLTPSKTSECDRILSFILHLRTWSQARNGTSLYPSAGGQRQETSARPAGLLYVVSSRPALGLWNEYHTPSFSLEAFSMSLCSLNSFGFINNFRLSLSIVFFGSSSFRRKKKIFNNLKEKTRVTTPSFSETLPHYIWRFLPHQRGWDWKMKRIFGSHIVPPVLGLINKVASRSQLISTQLSILFNKTNYSWRKRFSTVTSASW